MIKNEFQLIDSLTKNFFKFHRNLVVGVGDDVAVIKNGRRYLLLTCDAVVEGDHFNCQWSTPQQIGRKAIEVNVSDIASSGGRPTYLLVSLVLTKDTKKEWIMKVYDGIREICEKYRITLAGGNITHGITRVIDVSLMGETQKPILRSGARVGDVICVTGRVGGSNAGLKLFLQGKKLSGLLRQRHLEPKARLDVSGKIAKYANSMVDVSDGVASETRHICEQSKKGAIVYAEKIPLCPGASLIDALSGGEDYELMFTMASKNARKLKKEKVDFSVIGEIKSRGNGVCLMKNGKKHHLCGGYDHFKS